MGIIKFIDTKSIIIVVLVIALLTVTDGCGYFNSYEGVTETTTTKVDTSFSEKTKVAKNDSASLSPTENQYVIFDKDKVSPVSDSRELTEQEKDSGATKKKLNKYKATSVLPNGTIESTILSSGIIYSTEYSLSTTDTTITEETTTERVVAGSGLYGYGSIGLGVNGGLKSSEVGLIYLHRNRWFIGAGVNYITDPFLRNVTPIQRVSGVVTIGIKL